MTTTDTATSVLQVPRAGLYGIDLRGSTVTFSGRHLFGLAPVKGSFAIGRGTAEVADPIADSRVHVEIDAASFHTGGRHRDADVRSARFLDVERHPTMTFTSQRLERSGDGWALAGTLTVRDVARPLRLVIQRSTVQAGAPASFAVHAVTRIDRTDFGLKAARGLAGRHLDVALRVLWVRR